MSTLETKIRQAIQLAAAATGNEPSSVNICYRNHGHDEVVFTVERCGTPEGSANAATLDEAIDKVTAVMRRRLDEKISAHVTALALLQRVKEGR